MAEDIYFSKKKKTDSEITENGNTAKNGTKKRDSSDITVSFAEKINEEILHTRPGSHAFGDIVTEEEVITGTAPSKTKRQNEKEQKKKSRSKKMKIARAFLFTFLAFLIITGILVTSLSSYVLSDYDAKDFGANEYTDESSLIYSDSVYNILLMGIDTLSTEDSSRSDAMILLSVDSKHNKIKLSSFLRDSYVYIPGSGNAKLNASCVYGGPQLVCDTIEYNFGIRIDDYAKIGYDMFIKIIDAVGGIEIPEIDETEAKALAREGFITEPGTNIKVNGTEALAYCRIRKGQSDFYRTERQREVISLVLRKITKANPTVLINTAKEIAGTMECSIDSKEFPALLLRVLPCLIGDIEQMSVPADGTWYDDTKNYQSVLIVDFEQNKEILNEFLYS